MIDCCKIVAAQAVTDQDIWEMEFQKHSYPTEFLPMGAIVTASGTGAEMNNGAVITNEETNQKAGVLALADFIREIVLPSTFAQMGLTDKSVLKKVADSCNLTAGCCKKLSREEVLEILMECW